MGASSWRLCCSKIPQRWVFAIMGCLGITITYTARISLSLAITEMVVTTSAANDTGSDETCSATESTTSTSNNNGVYDWDEYTKGIILSCFFWGFIVSQIPCGILADRFGGKWTLAYGILSTSTFTLLTPTVVKAFNSTGLIIVRVLIGLGEGTIHPSLIVLIAHWAPPDERSLISTVVQTGAQVGSLVGSALSGVLIQNSSLGWEIVFYVYGSVGILWCLIFVVLCYRSPEVHPFIGEKEKMYLRDKIQRYPHKKTQKTPWRHILTSVPVWALLAAKWGHDCGAITLVADLPLYMSSILHFSITTNGLLNALPHFALWAASIPSSWLADWLVKADKLSTKNVRKVFTTFAAVCPAILIIAASYAGCNRTLVVILFTLGMGTMAPFYSGVMVNAIDLSPNHSGIIMSLVTTAMASAGIVTPYVIGVLTPDQTLSEWRIVFWITFAALIGSSLIFLLLGDGEIQYWNDLEPKNQANKNLEIIQIPDEHSPEIKCGARIQ